MSGKERLWTGTFVLNMGLNFAFYLVFYLLTVIMELVATSQFHASAGIAGLLSGIFIVGGFAGRLWTGKMLAKLDQKRLLIWGTAFYLVTTLLYFVTSNVALLAVLRLVHGFGFGIASTIAGTLAGQLVPLSRQGEGIGYYALSVTMASAIGPFLSIFIYQLAGYEALLSLATTILILGTVGAFFIKIPKFQHATTKKPAQSKKSGALFEKTALPISIIALLIGVAYASIVTFLASYTTQTHLVTAGSLYYVVYALMALVSRPFTGRIFDEKGDNYVLYPAMVLFMIGLILTGWASSSWELLLGAAFVGLGFGTFSPFGQAIAIRHSAPERIGAATSTFYGLFDMGVGVGPFALGFILPLVGYANIYYLAAGLVVLVLAAYYLMHGRHVRK
ncbi:MFS transporter [Weissella muntiaci]|uniref:MFS transporter n=1 Tax=Weissella muntiaci TaxID=2508881 RepID=A0A6C2C5J0_9LACO|nr:MFS transporter [Weissella muntiaci]TYC48992.1 MFS transporter [Weissella muntiaci]